MAADVMDVMFEEEEEEEGGGSGDRGKEMGLGNGWREIELGVQV